MMPYKLDCDLTLLGETAILNQKWVVRMVDSDGRSHASPFEVETLDGEPLATNHLYRLAAGRVAAIEVKQFFSGDCLAVALAGVSAIPMDLYDTSAVQPPVLKAGAALFNRYKELDRYKSDATLADELFSEYFEVDIREQALLNIELMTGLEVRPLPIGAMDKASPGLVRDLSGGARIHFDDVDREAPELPIPPLAAKLSLNIHLSMPISGGEVTIYEHPWRPSDEEFRDGYGYHPGLVAHDRRVSFRPQVGSAVIFMPHMLHSVNPGSDGKRLTLSFFLGLHPDGWLAAWS